MQLIDIGANLTHESFRHDLDDVLKRAYRQHVTRLIVTASSARDSQQCLHLARAHPRLLYATVGVHPHHANEYDTATDTCLRQLAHEEEVRAIGETGLDYFRDLTPRHVQLAAFERQLAIAADLGKPLFTHQRDAHSDFLALLRQWRSRVTNVVVHCFTDTREALHDYLSLDCHIGITGWICDERRGSHLRQLARDIPSNRLMIETDAPYLLPRTLQPKPSTHRNEPMYLHHICEAIAHDRGENIQTTAANSTATAISFFGLEEGQNPVSKNISTDIPSPI